MHHAYRILNKRNRNVSYNCKFSAYTLTLNGDSDAAAISYYSKLKKKFFCSNHTKMIVLCCDGKYCLC
ncbi:hypothetical protein DERF_006955 [Dermatophagoides farinae]|uniref:Uncharacterized protein n=1 Tax=Dermatophagoides farinae TaxID=6954 RepID=A0A922I2G3_DERFA|nr:hypothetical protein DERF_006955 [Dermatophagoides farinae]